MTSLSRPDPSDPALNAEERELGMARDITRRDFVNAMVVGTGATLLGCSVPGWCQTPAVASAPVPQEPWHPWTGYGGVGDYAISNGNTWDVVTAGHDGARDATYEHAIAQATPTGERYDLVIVGGGFAGVVAACTFLKETQRQKTCLLLDNHPLIGGEAKRNEFLVRGQRLIGPQGSNMTHIPTEGWAGELWREVGLPTEFEFAQMPASRRPMEFPLDNYWYQRWDFDPAGKHDNHGYFFDTPRPHWVTNPWGHNLAGTPWPEPIRRDLLRWRDEPAPAFQGGEENLERWLDTMTYADYLTKVRQLHPEVARFVDPVLASGYGAASDVISACLAYRAFYPGFQGLWAQHDAKWASILPLQRAAKPLLISFPGGNEGILRTFIKWLNPAVIEGSTAFADVHNGHLRFEEMDRPGTPCRMRAGATVVRVVPEVDRKHRGRPATITYLKDSQLRSIEARAVIWAGASWTAKHVVERLPEAYRTAMERFPRSPMLVVNVALDNWQALYRLGYSACSWRGGFGHSGNIRAPMYVGEYRPPLDPDQPTIFTFNVPFPQPGLSLVDQGKVARAQLLSTSYREFEMQIRRQLVKLFGDAGFDPARDISGIVLNRWGHAYVNAGPGFFFGHDGRPVPSAVLRQPLGNLTFANSELNGQQGWIVAGDEGERAARQVVSML